MTKDIEQIVNYKFLMYFLRFSEAIIRVRGQDSLKNDWYEYVEYGTSNDYVIALQKYGFLREEWDLNRMQKQLEEIDLEPGDQCSSPYKCWYYEYCHRDG